MKCRIISYDWDSNRALIEFESDFSGLYDKFANKDCNIEIKVWRPKRSGAANRYLWVLADKIARELHVTKDEVYIEEIRDIGGVSDVLVADDEVVDRFCKQWETHGLGWQTEVISNGDGQSTIIVYYGSSTFDVDQMNQLIDNLIYQAKQLGIDTDTPDRQAWWESVQEEANKNGK